MKTKLLKKWRSYAGIDTKNGLGIDAKNGFKSEPAIYAHSSYGTKFFAKWMKYSRHWSEIKIECDLHGYKPKQILDKQHPLHRFSPSERYHHWQTKYPSSMYFGGIDFSGLYLSTLSIQIPSLNVDTSQLNTSLLKIKKDIKRLSTQYSSI